MTEQVFLGSKNAHPNANPFRIAAVREQILAPGATRSGPQPRLTRPVRGIPREAFASVDFASSPAGAEISTEGRFVGDTLSRLSFRAGRHTTTLRLNEYRTWTQTLQVESGSQAMIRKTLRRM